MPLSNLPTDVHRTPVFGVDIDPQTRCAHWRGPLDVIAIRFHCCGEYYGCFDCHAQCADHAPSVWPRSLWGTAAILCGVCGRELSIDEYLPVDACPSCQAAFNPGCANHYHLYFDMTDGHR